MEPVTSAAPQHLELPFELLPSIDEQTLSALVSEVHRVNDRYLQDFIEEYAFCPFARSGRVKGQTRRYVHYADSPGVESILDLMDRIAQDESQVVVQVVFPLVEVGAREWREFSHRLTEMGNARGGWPPVLACAPLHPELEYDARDASTIIPLFRRSPDPTIQWVRLDGLDAIYEGRNHRTVFVEPGDIMQYLNTPQQQSLYDRIAQSNLSMARRFGIERAEELLAEYAEDGRRSYARVLLGELDR